MATLTIKNIPDALYQEIKKMAVDHRRSINSEVIVCLEQAVHKGGASAQERQLQARSVRVKANTRIRLTNKLINDTKRKDRS